MERHLKNIRISQSSGIYEMSNSHVVGAPNEKKDNRYI